MRKTNISDIEHKRMTETPITRLVVTLSIPTVISMLMTSIYNMADTYFVSSLGDSPVGAVGIVFSHRTYGAAEVWSQLSSERRKTTRQTRSFQVHSSPPLSAA